MIQRADEWLVGRHIDRGRFVMITDLKLDPNKLGQEAQFVGESKAMTEAGLDIGSLINGIVEESSDQASEGICLACSVEQSVTRAHWRLAELRVSRISYGPQPYRLMMQSFAEAALSVYSIHVSG